MIEFVNCVILLDIMMHLTINSFPLHCLLNSYVVQYTFLLPFYQVLIIMENKGYSLEGEVSQL